MSLLTYPDDPERVAEPGMSPRELSAQFSRLLRGWRASGPVEYTPEDLFTMHFSAAAVLDDIRRGDVNAATEITDALVALSHQFEPAAEQLLDRLEQIDSHKEIDQLLLQAYAGDHGEAFCDVMALALIEVASVRAILKVQGIYPGWKR